MTTARIEAPKTMDSKGSVCPLVSTTWLHEQLKNPPADLKVLDSSSTPQTDGRDDYLSSHIPGAQFFDLLECMTPTPLIPRNLPDAVCLQEYVRSLGVNKGDCVVLYDRGAIFASCRAWWTFRALGHERVAVLDGGIEKWKAEGLQTETGQAATPEKGDVEIKRNGDLIKSYEDVIDMVTNDSCQIVDARFELHFDGKEEEPVKTTKDAMRGVGMPQPTRLRKGHVKGAVNVFHERMFNQELRVKYKVFLEKEQLLKVFQEAGVDIDKPVTTMCYIGNASSLLALAAYLCGKEDVANYYGSWTEFGQRADDAFICGK